MSVWTPTIVNGLLADELVTDFGGTLATSRSLPPDSRMCLTLHYSSSAPTAVRLFLAVSPGTSPQDQILIYDSAFQVNPGADQTQYLTNIVVDVPIVNLEPLGLRITKGISDAIVMWSTSVRMGPGC